MNRDPPSCTHNPSSSDSTSGSDGGSTGGPGGDAGICGFRILDVQNLRDGDDVTDQVPDPIVVMKVEPEPTGGFPSPDLNGEVKLKPEPLHAFSSQGIDMEDLLGKQNLLRKAGTSSSMIWSFYGFEKNPEKPSEILNPKQVRCVLCNKKLSYMSSTSVMHKHLKSLHPKEARGMEGHAKRDRDQSPSSANRERPNTCAESGTRKPAQESLLTHFQSSTPYAAVSARHKELTTAVSRFIVAGMRPIYTVEEEGFRNMLKIFDQRYTLPSRKSFSSVIIPQLYNKVKEESVVPQLQEASYVALTTDMWTSRASDHYIGVTAHFVNRDWSVGHFTLENAELPPPHDLEHIASALHEILEDWKLKDKLSAVVTDNETNITEAVREGLGFPHISCFGHTLNLMVKVGLNSRGIKTTLARCSKLVEFARRSAKAKYSFAAHQHTLDFPVHKLIQDIDTRWGSTHDMLKRILEQQQSISNLLIKTKRKELDLSAHEVLIAKKIVEVLEPVRGITESFSSETSVTISGILPTISYLEGIFAESEDDLSEIRQVKREMASKLSDYYSDFGTRQYLLTAEFLDGRYKRLPFLSDTEKARVKDMVMREATTIIEQRRQAAKREFTEDSLGELTSGPPKKKKKKSLAALINEALGDIGEEDLHHPPPEQEAEDEIDRYLVEARLDADCCPLKWWSSKEAKYPTLATMAKKYLCTPATSVPAECLFSVSGYIVNAKRTLLTPANIGMLTFLHDNLKQ
uniref:E3 SUMO-protein ligase ZBED1-like isoform X1 n=2 Tax=Myxine glutinosa TaxID=7769 RepID=UPI00358E7A74